MKPHNACRTITAAILLDLTVCVSPSSAETASDGLPLWELGIGAALYNQPNYPGSDVRSTTGFPFPYVIYRGDYFRIDRSLQGILYETQRVKLDFSAGATSNVDSDESDAREGMPDLDPTFDIGPALSILLTDPARPDSIWGRVAVRTAISIDTDDWNFKQQGWIFDTRLRYQRPLIGEKLKVSTEIGATFADEDNLGYFYNVDPAFATAWRPAYSTDSGYAGAHLGLGLSGVYGKWRWSLYGAYMNFQGASFADSPLLDSKHDFSLGASVGWMFWQSERRVAPKNTSPGNEFETPLFGL